MYRHANRYMEVVLLFVLISWLKISASTLTVYSAQIVREIIELNGTKLFNCEKACQKDDFCSSFYLLRNISLDAYEPLYRCYLLSKPADSVLQSTSVLHPGSGINGCYGTKIEAHHNPADPKSHILLKGPLGISTSTTLSFATYMASGCQYTLSFHFWLPRPSSTVRPFSNQAILSTTPIYQKDESGFTPQLLLPAVLYGVAKQPDKLFFSLHQRQYGEYMGMWLSKVRFHTWTHVAIVMDGNVGRFFVDGSFVDYLKWNSSQCPPRKQAFNVSCEGNGSKSRFVHQPEVAENVAIRLEGCAKIMQGLLLLPRALNDSEVREVFLATRPDSHESDDLSQLAQQLDSQRSSTGWEDHWGPLLCVPEECGRYAQDARSTMLTNMPIFTPETTVPDIGILLPAHSHLSSPLSDPQAPRQTPVVRLVSALKQLVGVATETTAASWSQITAAEFRTPDKRTRRYSDYVRTALSDHTDHYYSSAEGQVQLLYRMARHRLRVSATKTAVPATTSRLPSEASPLSLLLLALAVSEQVERQETEKDEPWPFRTASHIQQPLLLLLAHYTGNFSSPLQYVLSHGLLTYAEEPTYDERDEPIAVQHMDAFEERERERERERAESVLGEAILLHRRLHEHFDSPATPRKASGAWGRLASSPVHTLAMSTPQVHELALKLLDYAHAYPEKAWQVLSAVSSTRTPRHTLLPPAPTASSPSAREHEDEHLAVLLSRYAQRGPSACEAAAYLFPVSQYVVANFGRDHSGAGVLDHVRLERLHSVTGHAGEDDDAHTMTAHDAHANDPDAQTWLGKKYFWGLGGVPRDHLQARYWFERAAAQGHPEGLYNLGVLYDRGDAGLPIDRELALEYIQRAAHAPEPFPMALHAVGNHYRFQEKNLTRAMEYLRRAVELGCEDAVFSLATLTLERGDPAGAIPMLAAAARRGHVRAISYLAHGLVDVHSWWHHFGREMGARRGQRAYETALGVESADQSLPSNGDTAPTPHQPIHFLLEDELVTLPAWPRDGEAACRAALPLLRYLSLRSYRPKDVVREAMRKFLAGDYRRAVESFEEAADLGLRSAQANAAYLLDSQAPAVFCDRGDGTSDYEVDCVAGLRLRALHRHAQLAVAGETPSLHYLAQLALGHNASHLDVNVTAGVQLLQSAAENGNAQSAVDLGWLAYYGYEGVARNVTRAKLIFLQALEMELLGTSFDSNVLGTPPLRPSNISRPAPASQDFHPHTAGMAPALALAAIAVDQVLVAATGIDLRTWKAVAVEHASIARQLPSSVYELLSGKPRLLRAESLYQDAAILLGMLGIAFFVLWMFR